MPNYCDSVYRITGESSEIDALYSLMISTEKKHGNWVGHLVQALNNDEIPDHLYVRGWWDDLSREADGLRFHQDSAWEPLYEAWDFIASKFKTLEVFFIGEEPGCEVFMKRDNPTKGWFPENYYLDACTPMGEYHHEYFETIDEALKFIEQITGDNIITWDAVSALNSVWNEMSEDAFIYLHEFTEV